MASPGFHKNCQEQSTRSNGLRRGIASRQQGQQAANRLATIKDQASIGNRVNRGVGFRFTVNGGVVKFHHANGVLVVVEIDFAGLVHFKLKSLFHHGNRRGGVGGSGAGCCVSSQRIPLASIASRFAS